jgi:hypothetical protein
MTSLEAKRFKDSLNKVKGLLDSVILDKDRWLLWVEDIRSRKTY